jgi:hypothetical protein
MKRLHPIDKNRFITSKEYFDILFSNTYYDSLGYELRESCNTL